MLKFISHPSLVLLSITATLSPVGCAKQTGNQATTQVTAPSTPYSGLGAESVSQDRLKSFAPKELPADLSRQIQLLMDIRSPGKGLITKSGKTLFFTWFVTGKAQVWKWDQRVGFPIQMTGGEDETGLQGLLPNENFIVVSRDQKGEENPGIYLQNVEGGPLVKIFHKKGVQAHYMDATEDSEFLYFSANDQKPASRTLYRFQMSNGQIEKIFDKEGTWAIADQKNSDTLLLVKWIGNTQNEYYEYSISSKQLRPILGQGKTEELSIQYGAGPDEFLVLTNMFGNFKRLYTLKAGAFNPITDEAPYDIESFDIDRKRQRIIIQSNEGGYFKTYVRDAKTFKPIELPKIEADHIINGNFSLDGRYVTLSIEKSSEPAATAVYDFEKKELKTVLLPSSPEVDLESFAETSLEYYPARDGTKIPMLVRRPLACKDPCPVIVHFHGGPEGQSSPGFSQFAQIFVDGGFIFVEPNVRGSEGYGKEWLNADNGPKRLEVITDIEDAALFIKQNWKKGSKAPRVGVMGYSYGGYSTLYAMTRFAGAYDAGVALVGMSNLVTFLQNTAPYRRHLRISEYGDPEKDKEALIQLSPMTFLDKLKDPLLVIQGASDPRVPVGEALQIYDSVKAKGGDIELMIFADEGHGASSRANRVLEMGNTLKFFQAKLQN